MSSIGKRHHKESPRSVFALGAFRSDNIDQQPLLIRLL